VRTLFFLVITSAFLQTPFDAPRSLSYAFTASVIDSPKKRTNAGKCFIISASHDAQTLTSTHPIISGLGMSLHVSSSFPNLYVSGSESGDLDPPSLS
jgi:hypothetical protein